MVREYDKLCLSDPIQRQIKSDYLQEDGRSLEISVLQSLEYRGYPNSGLLASAPRVEEFREASAAGPVAARRVAEWGEAQVAEGLTESESTMDLSRGLVVLGINNGSYYPGLIVGWLEHVKGDEYVLKNSREFKSAEGKCRTQIANDGVQESSLFPISKTNEDFHRLNFCRVSRCNMSVWLNLCPKPDGWVD